MNGKTTVLAVLFLAPLTACAFVAPRVTRRQLISCLEMAKKKRKGGQALGKGFGKENEISASKPVQSSPTESVLQSVESGGSTAIPTMMETPETTPEGSNVPNVEESSLSPEERTKQILRDQYGLKTLEEQQTDAKKREKMAEDRKKREEWRKMAEREDMDIMQLLPAPLLIAIDRFLKGGVAVCTVLFVAAGMGITAEAWSAASGNPLPDDLDQFIVNVVEPNFTPGLLVLLGFSVSLGIFAALQLGSESSQYREDN